MLYLDAEFQHYQKKNPSANELTVNDYTDRKRRGSNKRIKWGSREERTQTGERECARGGVRALRTPIQPTHCELMCLYTTNGCAQKANGTPLFKYKKRSHHHQTLKENSSLLSLNNLSQFTSLINTK